MLTALLENEAAAPEGNSGWITWVLLGVVVVIFVVFFIFSSRKNKKRQEEEKKLIDAIKPGNKIKTIGGVCGIVVEIDRDENTFVLETGSEVAGKSYMKFDMQAIYQTDAVVEDESKKEKKSEGKEEPFEEGKAAETETAEAPAEEKAEEKPAEDGKSEN